MLFSKSKSSIILSELVVAGLCGLVSPAIAQTVPPSGPDARPVAVEQSPAGDARNFNDVVTRTIGSEHVLISKLRGKEPVIETYIQEMKSDSDLGLVPRRDFYFLGKLDISDGVVRHSFLPGTSLLMRIPHFFATLVNPGYNPLGFADEIFPDVSGFDRAHYAFKYVRREFLGDVRCIVMDVWPVKGAGKGRFEGRMWVEDRDYNIVRFNGTYYPSGDHEFSHFDSWRVNAAPGLWLPSNIYAQEEAFRAGPVHYPPMRGQTRLWDYEPSKDRSEQSFTNLTVDIPQGVSDESDASADNPPVQSERLWETQAEDNIIGRLQEAGLVAPEGEMDQVLDTVLNNVEVTNNINIDPKVHVRILLTTPLESVAVNHTILISRGLIDVLPDEACLAAVLAHELSHVLLGHSVNTKYAFADRLLFDDPSTLKRISLARTQREEEAADQKAMELLKNSPYNDKLPRVGLFLRMLSARSNEVPHLVRPLIGNRMAETGKDQRFSGLMEISPELQIRNPEQIAALPLGSRVRMDPWSDQLHLMKAHNVRLLSAKEKLPFQVTPFMLHLTRENSDSTVASGASATSNGTTARQ